VVRFIKDDNFRCCKSVASGCQVVEKAPRRGNKNLESTRNHIRLWPVLDPPDDDTNPNAWTHELTIGTETLRDLGGEFTRGGQNERAHHARRQTAAVGEDPAEDWQSKSCCLSRARLSDAEKITPL
jgi:hypothetical protein